MDRMNYNELKQHAEMCQMSADEMAFNFIKFTNEVFELSKFQSKCDFNLFWIYSLSPIFVRINTIIFLNSYIEKFKRKITIKELLIYDSIINLINPETFEDFILFFNNKRSY